MFVDDDGDTAKTFANFVARNSQFITVATSSPEDAVAIARREPIAVAVLDQSMPAMTGTDLFTQLALIRPSIRAVMLSGVATREDVSTAFRKGYVADVRKDDLSALVPAIQRAYAEYLLARRQLLGVRFRLTHRGVDFPLMPRIVYFVDWLEQISEPYVPETEWKLVEQVNAGQSIEREITYTTATAMVVESIFETGIEGNAGLKVSSVLGVEGAVRTLLKGQFKTVMKADQSSIIRIKQNVSLPSEPVDPFENSVKARGFYVGAEFLRVRLGITKVFLPFGDEAYGWIDISAQTGRFLTKQIDILTNGDEVIRATNPY